MCIFNETIEVELNTQIMMFDIMTAFGCPSQRGEKSQTKSTESSYFTSFWIEEHSNLCILILMRLLTWDWSS